MEIWHCQQNSGSNFETGNLGIGNLGGGKNGKISSLSNSRSNTVDPCVTCCGSASTSVNEKLLRAVGQNHPACVKALLRSGPDVNAEDDIGTPTLILAFENEFDDTISILIDAGANVIHGTAMGTQHWH